MAKRLTMKQAQERYDNLTPETINRVPRPRIRISEDDDYEDRDFYRSKRFSRIMDAYERQIYGP